MKNTKVDFSIFKSCEVEKVEGYFKHMAQEDIEKILNESVDPKGRTPLMLSVIKGHLDVVKWLIDNYYKIIIFNKATAKESKPSKGDKGFTALHFAALHNHADIARLLLRCGAYFDAGENQGIYTPVQIAVSNTKELLEKAKEMYYTIACLKTKPEKGRLIKAQKNIEALAKEINPTIFSSLPEGTREKPKNDDVLINSPREQQSRFTSLRKKVKKNILHRKIPGALCGEQDSILHIAIRNKFDSLVNVLLRNGADPELRNGRQASAKDLSNQKELNVGPRISRLLNQAKVLGKPSDVLSHTVHLTADKPPAPSSSASTSSTHRNTRALEFAEVVANFNENDEDSLDVRKGDLLIIIGEKEKYVDQWWQWCRETADSAREGYVPCKNLSIIHSLFGSIKPVAARTRNKGKERALSEEEEEEVKQKVAQSVLTVETFPTNIGRIASINSEEEIDRLITEESFDIKEELQRLRSEIKAVQREAAFNGDHLKVLWMEYEVKRAQKQAIKAFKSQPNLYLFYTFIATGLSRLFVGNSAVASKLAQQKLSTKAFLTTTAINGLADTVSSIPIINTFGTKAIGQAMNWVSKGVEFVDKQRRLNEAINISDLMTLRRFEKVAYKVAESLTRRYAEQLLLLTTPEEQQAKRGVLKKAFLATGKAILKRKPSPDVKIVAAYGVTRLYECLVDIAGEEGTVALGKAELTEALINKIAHQEPSENLKKFWKEILSKTRLKAIQIIKRDDLPLKDTLLQPYIMKRCHPSDLYTKPGIKFWDGSQKAYLYLTRKGTEAKTFGWMEEDNLWRIADQGRWKLCNAPQFKKVSGAIELNQKMLKKFKGDVTSEGLLKRTMTRLRENYEIKYTSDNNVINISLENKRNLFFVELMPMGADLNRLATDLRSFLTEKENIIHCKSATISNEVIQLTFSNVEAATNFAGQLHDMIASAVQQQRRPFTTLGRGQPRKRSSNSRRSRQRPSRSTPLPPQ